MTENGMLTRFIQMFIDIFNIFVPADFPLSDYFKAIIVLVVIICSILGALLFAAVSVNAVFSVFKSR